LAKEEGPKKKSPKRIKKPQQILGKISWKEGPFEITPLNKWEKLPQRNPKKGLKKPGYTLPNNKK